MLEDKVPSQMLSIEKVARMVELFTDPNGEDIDATKQKTFIKTLRGDSGTYHAGMPTLQKGSTWRWR